MTKQEAIAHFGSARNLAKALTAAGYPITFQAVAKWGRVPDERQRQIDEIVRGRVKVK